ncbi:class I SAM-dependent methyltransferase [Candidatus Pacearchaeota archaeon]|jgi:2-polyprenyl-3-methyl-5-hydroxy-6-metoxy-1,4-benzoquinol methylase|nr:class I SAM-dependent methyltransferase [Candidatus Pacearchaeota archaeon]
MTQVDEYWNKHLIYDKYFTSIKESDDYLAWRSAQYPMAMKMLELENVDYAGKKILDYGCGPGHDVIEFLKAGADFVVGCDVSKKALDITNERVKLYGYEDKVALILNTNQNSNIGDFSGEFDHVHCGGVLHHVNKPVEILNYLYDYLKEDCHANLMVYNRDSIFFHFYVAFVLRILSSKESGYPNSDKYSALDNTDYVFSKSTDGEDCPVSIAYKPEDFIKLSIAKIDFIGGYPSKLDLKDFFDSKYISDKYNLLEKEHTDFLEAVTFDDQGFPWCQYKDERKLCGSGGVYRMVKI